MLAYIFANLLYSQDLNVKHKNHYVLLHKLLSVSASSAASKKSVSIDKSLTTENLEKVNTILIQTFKSVLSSFLFINFQLSCHKLFNN